MLDQIRPQGSKYQSLCLAKYTNMGGYVRLLQHYLFSIRSV